MIQLCVHTDAPRTPLQVWEYLSVNLQTQTIQLLAQLAFNLAVSEYQAVRSIPEVPDGNETCPAQNPR